MKKILVFILILTVQSTLLAQKSKKREISLADEENMVFKHEWSLGARIHTNGFSAFFERVWIKNIWKRNVLQTNFFYYRSFKDRKTKSIYTSYSDAVPYFYGKQNNFWSINVLYGQKKVIAEKAEKSGVRLCFVYMGGVSLGILKPYGLKIIEQSDVGNTKVYFYDENNPEVFLDPLNANTHIYGAAGIGAGFNKIKPVAGAHLKFGLNFDWASRESFIKSLEVGTQVDIYYKKLPVYITNRNKPYILNLYLGIQLGKRW
ncbi:MAG: hypothetical protein R2836_04255 [Chitinophagales bacterium]